MKLNTAHWAWLLAALAFFLGVVADVADLWEFPTSYMLPGALLLTALGWLVGPSWKQLTTEPRRG